MPTSPTLEVLPWLLHTLEDFNAYHSVQVRVSEHYCPFSQPRLPCPVLHILLFMVIIATTGRAGAYAISLASIPSNVKWRSQKHRILGENISASRNLVRSTLLVEYENSCHFLTFLCLLYDDPESIRAALTRPVNIRPSSHYISPLIGTDVYF